MIKRLAVSLALLFAAMILVFGDWAVSEEGASADSPGIERRLPASG